jgi:hypothetical protein
MEHHNVLDYFFYNIFPLFEVVSQETKRVYGMQYTVAKIGVRLAKILRLTAMTKLFFPGFSVIARNGA